MDKNFMKGLNGDVEPNLHKALVSSSAYVMIGDDGKYHSEGVAFNKNREMEQCNKIKECKKCTAKNVTRNKKCFYCGERL